MNDPREREVGRADPNVADAREAARAPEKSGKDLEMADDRGGSRDGERLEPGDPGDRDQLDNGGGRAASRR